MRNHQTVSAWAYAPDKVHRFGLDVSSNGAVGCVAYNNNQRCTKHPVVRSVKVVDGSMYISLSYNEVRVRVEITNTPAWAHVAAARFMRTKRSIEFIF
jgi:hypothetical protein